MTEETDWIGGQLTSQAVPPDEHPWIESFGGTQSYRAYRNGVRQYYRDHYPLTAEARSQPASTPAAAASPPHPRAESVAGRARSLLAPYVSGGRLILLLRHKPVGADTPGRPRPRRHRARACATGADRTIEAPLLPRRHRTGRPAAADPNRVRHRLRVAKGDRRAPRARPKRSRPIIRPSPSASRWATEPGEDHTIDKPAEYAFWRDYVPQTEARLARQAPQLVDDRSHHAHGAQGHLRPRSRREPAGPQPLALPPHRPRQQLPGRVTHAAT